MSTRRGRKINPVKNYAGAKDFAEGKRVGRPKQVWVWDDPEPSIISSGVERRGHWEKINVLK
jgi:hypothetical protein